MFIDPIDTFNIVSQRQSQQRQRASAGRYPRVFLGVIERLPRRRRSATRTSSTVGGVAERSAA